MICESWWCVPEVFQNFGIYIEDDWGEECSNFDSPGADIDAVELIVCPNGDLESCYSQGFLVDTEGAAGDNACTNDYTDPHGAIGPVNYGSGHYISLAGGWVAGEFGPDNPIETGLFIRVHEYGAIYGGGDDPYDVWLMTDLSCLDSPDPEECMQWLGHGNGRTDFAVP